jgi:carboxylesterase type B
VVAHLCHTEEPDAVIGRYRERAVAGGAPDDLLSLLVEIATDAMVAEPLARWASARAGAVAGRGSVHRYRVDHPGAGPVLRATHTVEVPLVFGTWKDGGPGERLGGQAPGAGAVSADLVSAWGRFVHGQAPGWPPVAPDSSAPEESGAESSAPDVHVFGSLSGSLQATAEQAR